jgi:AcrR family transcriptional regulator
VSPGRNFYTVRYVYSGVMSGSAPNTRDRILQEALTLFSSKGYDGTSIREICEGAALTKPTLYYFFGSKEGLYRALVVGALESLTRELAETLAVPDATEERLKRVARGYFQAAREQRELLRFLFALAHNPAGAGPTVDWPRYHDEMVAQIARAFDEGVARGDLSPGSTELRVLVYMGALGETLSNYVLLGRPEPTPERADELTDTILESWRPR